MRSCSNAEAWAERSFAVCTVIIDTDARDIPSRAIESTTRAINISIKLKPCCVWRGCLCIPTCVLCPLLDGHIPEQIHGQRLGATRIRQGNRRHTGHDARGLESRVRGLGQLDTRIAHIDIRGVLFATVWSALVIAVFPDLVAMS